MTAHYNNATANLKQERISDDTLLHIGHLIRGCAELEDILTLFICELTGITEGAGTVLMGRAQISTKLQIAEYICKIKGDEYINIFKKCFGPRTKALLSCRNTVAHGVYLGITEKNEYAFLTNNQTAPDEGIAKYRVSAYLPDSISAHSLNAQRLVTLLEKDLQLKPLRDKRKQQVLQR